jgi:hypothetical protein
MVHAPVDRMQQTTFVSFVIIGRRSFAAAPVAELPAGDLMVKVTYPSWSSNLQRGVKRLRRV